MQLFFNISALFCLQRMWNILQTYWKLDIFIKPSDMIKLVKLPGNSKYHVWKTKFVVINIPLFKAVQNPGSKVILCDCIDWRRYWSTCGPLEHPKIASISSVAAWGMAPSSSIPPKRMISCWIFGSFFQAFNLEYHFSSWALSCASWCLIILAASFVIAIVAPPAFGVSSQVTAAVEARILSVGACGSSRSRESFSHNIVVSSCRGTVVGAVITVGWW